MKKILVMLLSLLLVFALCACGEEKAEEPTEETAVESAPEAANEEPAPEPFEPVTFEFSDVTVTVNGAEEFTDAEGEPAVRFYYDFTNNSVEPTSAWWALNITAAQNGEELAGTYAAMEDDVAEYGNSSLYVYPGVTIRCIGEFSYDPSAGGVLTLTVDDYVDEYTATVYAAALPGRPETELETVAIANPDFTADMPIGGEGDGYVLVIESAEVVDGWDDASVIRVYFEYTNNEDAASSCWEAVSVKAFQDGVELESQWAAENVPEDDAFNEEVEPGEIVSCSECWELTSESPVEVYVYDYMTGVQIGRVFPVV